MLLTHIQKKGLTEFTTMALARRTAASLSDLIGSPIVVRVSEVSLHPLSGLVGELGDCLPSQIATVHQKFIGSISGDALLLLDYYSALMLSNLLRHNGVELSDRLDGSDWEVLTEVGNIVLNGYLGMLGRMLQRPLSFSVPTFELKLLHPLAESLIVGKNEFRYALVVNTSFQLHDQSVNASLVLVSGVVSLSCLVKAIETWASIAVISI